jgi:hypothetical protein
MLASHAGHTRSTVTGDEEERRRRGGGEWRVMRAPSRERERERERERVGRGEKVDLRSNRAVIGVRWINLEVKEYSRKDARFSSNCLH